MSKTNPTPVFEILRHLHAPFGPTCPSLYQNLSECWIETTGDQKAAIIDWDAMHPSLDPLCLLDNPDLSGQKKHKMNVYDQTVFISKTIIRLPSPDTAPEGQKATRGQMKRWQVESFYKVLRCLCQSSLSGACSGRRQLRIVDFGCGSGSLLLPLASLFPHHTFVGVDMKVTSLAILNQRAECAGLSNIETFVGKIEDYSSPFDVALALHACGNASDMAILKAIQCQAAFILAPCCIGKLKFSLVGGSSFNIWGSVAYETPKMKEEEDEKRVADALMTAAGSNGQHAGNKVEHASQNVQPEVTLRHPRSKALRIALGESEAEAEFRRIARVADTNAETTGVDGTSMSEREWIERLSSALDGSCFIDKAQIAKIHIELDRLLAAAEEGYRVGLYRLINATSQAKGDLLVGVPDGSEVEGRGLMRI